MPRYYRRRYTRVVKPKKKWATNIVEIDCNSNDATLGGVGTKNVWMLKKICENSVGGATPTPVIVKTGNFKLQFDATFGLSVGAPLQFSGYLIYVPEGTFPSYSVDYFKQFVQKHPEWILCWKYGSYDYVTSGANGNIDSIKVSSRLKRNLNSGDAICFFGMATSTQNIDSAGGHGMCQFWTCAN